jgi:hypothetical protein
MITPEQLRNKFNNGQFFSVLFRKRSNGAMRMMMCRLSETMTKGKKGGTMPYNATEKNLVNVYDIVEGKHKCIPCDGIEKLNGENINV